VNTLQTHFATVSVDREAATVFGYRLPYLPDFLADHTLLGDTPSQRIEEFHGRWIQFVGWLWKWQNTCFAWRLVADPQAGDIQMALLGRVRHAAQKSAMALEVARDLERLLTTFGLPIEGLDEDGLRVFQSPFDSPYIAEIHQHEELLTFHLMAKDPQSAAPQGYVIHPFEGPSGSFLAPFETLLRQSQRTAVSLMLEPTRLSVTPPANERGALESAATRAETLKERQLMGDWLPQDLHGVRMADPHLALAARLYSSLTQRLTKPFLVLAQIASPDLTAAVTVAHALANATTPPSTDRRGAGPEPLPADTDVVSPAPEDTAGLQSARFAFAHLLHRPWAPSPSVHSPGLERLRYLTDARGAAALWRLPINVRGGVPGIAVRQPAPDFEPGPRPAQLAPAEVLVGRLRRGGVATASLQDFTRHTLITGFTGSGKTNTVLSLLQQLWNQHHIPFLVIEAAKKEYRSLTRVKGFEDLLVFTLGDETTAPFRFNPFELLPGVRVEAHLGRLQACFDAALPQFGILPSIIAEALEEIYRIKGWRLADRAPLSEAGAARRLFPTLRDLFDTVVRIAENRGYSGEMRDNIRAAAAGRIRNLLIGSRGRMLGAQRSFPADRLFTQPVILELNDLNEDDKAMTMMFLLMWLREYRELHGQRRLQHVTVVEEAHNVVSNVSPVGNSEVSADTKAKAVAAFANMLAEVRAYGEGIVISDQSPEKLAPDALRNTNLHIAHQLRDQHDREAIARAMIMDEEQQAFLGKLRTGEAAFFRTGMEKATFIRIPEFKDTAGFDAPPSDAAVGEHMRAFQAQQFQAALPFDGCRFCGSPCAHREAIEPHALDKEMHEQLLLALKRFDEQPAPEHWPEHWRAISAVCRRAAQRAGAETQLDAAYCFLAHSLDFAVTDHMRREFSRAFSEPL
jgi:hypothetical protein